MLKKTDKFYKSWENRKIGGVCAGIAKHFGANLVVTRVFAVILLLLFFPITLPLYFLIFSITPWDDPEALTPCIGKHPWLFAIPGFILLTLLPYLFSNFPTPSALHIRVPWEKHFGEIQNIFNWVVRYYYGYPYLGCWISILVVVLATFRYFRPCVYGTRLGYTVVFFLFSIIWALWFYVENAFDFVFKNTDTFFD